MRVAKVVLFGSLSALVLTTAGASAQDRAAKERLDREAAARQSAGGNQGAVPTNLRPEQGGTCGTPTVISALPFNDTGNTTGATNTVGTVGSGSGCGTITTNSGQTGGPDLVYSFTVGAGNNLTFVLTPTSCVSPGFDPAIYVLSACGNGTTCAGGSDTGGDCAPETLNVSGLAPGTYFFYVDSFYIVDAQRRSGPYSLSVTGTLGSVGGTPTPTSSPVPATSTPTSTPVVSTATPTPTSTAVVSTATPTITVTSSSTPTASATAIGGIPQNIPTLSPLVLALFGLGLAVVAFLLVRRTS